MNNIEKIKNNIITGKKFAVTAGAGAGKTTRLMNDIFFAISDVDENGNYKKPLRTLVLTYTNNAVEEINERYDLLVEKGEIKSPKIFITSTINAFFTKLANRYPVEVAKTFKSLVEKNDEINAIFTEKEISDINRIITDPRNPSVKDFTKIKGVTTEHQIDDDDSIKYGIFAIPQGSLVRFFASVVEKFEYILEDISNEFEVILIDEYQDTEPKAIDVFLNDFLKSSVGFYGDPNQMIYDQRNGVIESGVDKIEFDENYRSNQKIVDFANELRHTDEIKQVAKNNEENLGRLIYIKTNQFLNPNLNTSLIKKIEQKTGIELNMILYLTKKEMFYSKYPKNTIKWESNKYNEKTNNYNVSHLVDAHPDFGSHVSLVYDILMLREMGVKDDADEIERAYFNEAMESLKINDIDSIKAVMKFISDFRKDETYSSKLGGFHPTEKQLNDLRRLEGKISLTELAVIPWEHYLWGYEIWKSRRHIDLVNSGKISTTSRVNTIHSTKGNQYDNILISLNENSFGYKLKLYDKVETPFFNLLNKEREFSNNLEKLMANLFYVAVTRGRKNVILHDGGTGRPFHETELIRKHFEIIEVK